MLDKDFHDPAVTAFAKCYTCGASVRYGLARCPRCEIELDQERLLPSAFNHYVITQAVSAANSIRTYDFAVYFSIGASLIQLFSDTHPLLGTVASVAWLGALGLIIYWFVQHGRWDSDDEDYLRARAEMKKSFLLWLAANFFNLAVIFVKWAC